MRMTIRWYGEDDKVSLTQIRQVPGVTGVVSSIPMNAGKAWPLKKIKELKNNIIAYGLDFEVIESVPVHEDIKLGLPSRDRYIENYRKTLRILSKVGIQVVCYNFMPVYDWTRTDTCYELPDGSRTLAYDENIIRELDPLKDDLILPAWDVSYDRKKLLRQYQDILEQDLWKNLSYFIKNVIEVADEVGIKMAIHPDDPPWPVFGLPRIVTNREDLERVIGLADSQNNGITLCTGSLGADPKNDIPEIITHFGKKGRIHFAHVRNIKITGYKSFEETSHRSEDGSLDMYEVMKAFYDIGFCGYIRPDHGRRIWGEKGLPGYGLYDRALGATYLNGIWEAIKKMKC